MAETMQIDVATFMDWGEPKEVKTSRGLRLLHKAPVTEEFTKAWKSDKQALKDAGISMGKDRKTDEWEVLWWEYQTTQEDVDAQNDAIAASQQVDADIDIPCPEGLDYLPFQRAGIAYALARPNTLFGDDMGLGKTIQAIGVINATDAESILVVCPAFLRLNWSREIKKWLTRDLTIGIADSKYLPKRNIIIMSYQTLVSYCTFDRKPERAGKPGKQFAVPGPGLPAFDLRIVDEAHFCKNPKAKRTLATHCIAATRKLSLTGTPIPNRPIEAHPIIEDLAGWAFWGYAQRYCDGHRERYGWNFTGSSHMGELQQKLRAEIMVRRMKVDVLKELPPKIRQIIPLEGDIEAEMKLIAEVRADLGDDDLTWKECVSYLTANVAGFEQLSKARHETALGKVEQAVEFIATALEQSDKVIVFCHHRDVAEQLRDALAEFKPVLVYGGMTDRARDKSQGMFQHDTARVFIGTIGACGVGLTLTAADQVIFVELDWVPGNVTQAEDRAHRIGSEIHDSILVSHLVVDNSIDAHIAQTIVKKQQVIDAALNNPALVTADIQNTVLDILIKEDPEEKALLTFSGMQKEAIHLGLQILSEMCDGARELDGAGFNKMDSQFGKDLASRPFLSPKQLVVGQKFVRKYHRQLPDDLVVQATGNEL